jgi:Na+/proline symporter
VFTTRGSTAGVIAALAGGFVTVLLLQPWWGFAIPKLAFPYQLCAGTIVATVLAAIPRGRRKTRRSGEV